MIPSCFSNARACLRPLRAAAVLLCVLLLGACAGPEVVRGRLNYDVRPEGQRTAVFLPPAPEVARYRYAGELVGEPNFERSDKNKPRLSSVLNWVVGLFDEHERVMLQRPQHGAVGDDGRVFVVDAGRSAIVVFDPLPPPDDDSGDGRLLVWKELGERGRLVTPVALAIAWNGDIVVSDIGLGAVVRLTAQGELVGAFGDGEIQRPAGLAFDRVRNLLYVADAAAHDIKVYGGDGKLVKTIGGPGDEPGRFNAPTFMTFANDRLYVSDTLNSRVQIFDAEGKLIDGFGERGLYVGNFTRPKGIAVESGIVYVIESYYGYLLAYNEKNQLLLGINGNGVKGDKFLLPSGVWSDNLGRLYVADMFNARVVVFQFLGGEGD